ncbi:MAG: flagellar basal body rod protein FlgF [Pseudomonadota bacterium]
MDRALYIAANSARHAELAQAVHAHNLANVSTDGFRARFADTLADAVDGSGLPGRVYGVSKSPGFDFTAGTVRETGRVLDVAIDGQGMFTVQLPNGREAHTRNGAFRVDSAGRLMSEAGYQVVGGSGPITLPPYSTIVIAKDGSISVRPQGQGAETIVQVDRLRMVNPEPEDVERTQPGLFTSLGPNLLPFAPDVRVQSGALESSNVNAVSELTEILALARRFEIETRLMSTAEDNDAAATQLLRIG